MAYSAPSPFAFEPQWLSPDDVKSWLRINNEDASDDALILAVCAQTEPYVKRCRPEWTIPAEIEATLRLQADYYSTEIVIRLDEWQEANPDHIGGLVDQRGHIVKLTANPGDDWGVADPNKPTIVVATLGGELHALPLTDRNDGNPVTVGETITRMLQGTPFVLTMVTDDTNTPTHYTAATPSSYLPDAETYQGARMYAAREYRRRNSPAGIEVFGDVTSFVSRYDPDIDRALQTGAYARPVIA